VTLLVLEFWFGFVLIVRVGGLGFVFLLARAVSVCVSFDFVLRRLKKNSQLIQN
jgi:hypothetical protein